MAKTSGGGASGSGGRSRSVLSGGESISISNERSRSGGGQWRYTTLEASEGSAPGELSFGYPRGKLTQINRNTTRAEYNIRAGVYDQAGYRRLQSYGINWDNVSKVSGETRDIRIRGFLKDKGFKWDGTAWVK
jgi:hypothetical protein